MKKSLQISSEKKQTKIIPAALAFLTLWLIASTCSAQFGASPWKAPTGSYTVPAGVTSITVECQGGGGGGGGNKSGGCSVSNAGGGGGGAYSLVVYSVTPGQTIQVVVGAAGAKGASNGGSGGAGGQSSVAYNSTIFVSADGGSGGTGAQGGPSTGAGGIGGSGGVGLTYLGGYGASGTYNGSGGGGGGAGSMGDGNHASGSSAGGGGFGNPFGGSGAAGKPNSCDGWAAGANGAAPGGGGGGSMSCGQINCSGASYGAGGAGGVGQVTITYVAVTVNPLCTGSCSGWFLQSCTACPKGCYYDAGAVTPTPVLQTASSVMDTSNFGLVFWNFNATAGTTYYFDLCASTGTDGSSWLRLHKARTTNPNNNYCMDAGNTGTILYQNVQNGCAGTGTGLSKLIWTCDASGTYYLESASNATPNYWGISGSQTTVLSYKTLPSSSSTCTDVFYDKGIDGTNGSSAGYNNNENWTYTYYPTNTVTDAISYQFTSFSSAAGDVLTIYDGNSVLANIIGTYSGPSISIPTYKSTAADGSITFQFTSDDVGVAAGWAANISCVDNVAVGNYSSANKLRIFPNPAKDQLEISGLKKDEITSIQILDVVGKNVFNPQPLANNSQSKTTIDVSALPAGIYFVRIENASGMWNGKFVKE